MTIEKAIFILANIDRRVCDDELSEAFDMAIKALEQEPCEDALSPTVELVGLEEAKKLIYQEWKSKVAEDNPNQRLLVAYQIAMKALEQEPSKDEVILTKEEYGELVSSEFDNGYAKGYREALEEQEPILDKIRAEIESCREDEEPHLCDYRYYRNEGLDMTLDIIDKYNAESEP